MIVDNIKNFDLYVCVHRHFNLVRDFIEKNDLSQLDIGRHDILGDEVYLSLQEYETKSKESAKAESHKKYIDIQMVISGDELIGYADVSKSSQYTFYDEQKDFQLLNAEVDFIKADNSNFFVFFPQDVHMPSIAVTEPSSVKKAVFKIKI